MCLLKRNDYSVSFSVCYSYVLMLGAYWFHLFKYLSLTRIVYHHSINLCLVLSWSIHLAEKIVCIIFIGTQAYQFFHFLCAKRMILMKNFKLCLHNLVCCLFVSSRAFCDVVFFMPDIYILIHFFTVTFNGTKMVAQGFTVDLNKPLVCQVRRAFLDKCFNIFCPLNSHTNTSIFNFFFFFCCIHYSHLKYNQDLTGCFSNSTPSSCCNAFVWSFS